VPGAQRRLGRGLDAILPELRVRELDNVQEIECALIDAHPAQPRRHFDPAAMDELTESVRVHGVLQPIIVRPLGGRYQVVAGERRLRAAVRAGLERVPAVVRDLSDAEVAEVALVENLLREDLNPLEEAEALRRLIEEFGLTQEEVAAHLGRSRPAIANALRLLQAGPALREALARGEVTAGHARALLALPDEELQAEGVARIRRRGWSVRETERWVRRVVEGRGAEGEGSGRSARSPAWRAVEEALQAALGTRVRVRGEARRGVVEIEFFGLADLERLVELICGGAPGVSRETPGLGR